MKDIYFYIGITIVFILLGLLIKKSKILFIAQVIWLSIICCFNIGGMDFLNNYYLFEDSNTPLKIFMDGFFGWGYRGLSYIFISHGYDFDFFNIAINLISIVLLIVFIRKYSKNPNIVMSYIYIYPMTDFVIQKRWFPAMVLLLFACMKLEEKLCIKNIIGYIILVILALGFHSAASLFFIFLIFKIIKSIFKINEKKLLIMILCLEMILIKVIPNYLGGFFGKEKVNLYFVQFAENSSMLKFLCWTLVHISFFVIIRLLRKWENKNEFLEKVYSLNFYSLMIIPFYLYDPVFIRIYRVFIIIDYICLTNNYVIKTKMSRSMCIRIFGVLGLVLIYGYIFYVSSLGAGFEELVVPIFKDNSILG